MGGGEDPLGHGRFAKDGRYQNIAACKTLPRFYSGAKADNTYYLLEGWQFVMSAICLGKFGDYVYFSSSSSLAPLCIYTNGSLQRYEKYNITTDNTAISNILDLLPESWYSTLGKVNGLYQYRHDDLVADGIGYNR